MDYTVVTGIEQIGDFINDLSVCTSISLDTESSGLDYFTETFLLLQVKLNNNTYIFDVQNLGKKFITYIVTLIVDSNRQVIGHNIKYDFQVIYHNTGETLKNVYDTM